MATLLVSGSISSIQVMSDKDGARLYIRDDKDGCDISTDGLTWLRIEAGYLNLVIGYLKTHR